MFDISHISRGWVSPHLCKNAGEVERCCVTDCQVPRVTPLLLLPSVEIEVGIGCVKLSFSSVLGFDRRFRANDLKALSHEPVVGTGLDLDIFSLFGVDALCSR